MRKDVEYAKTLVMPAAPLKKQRSPVKHHSFYFWLQITFNYRKNEENMIFASYDVLQNQERRFYCASVL